MVASSCDVFQGRVIRCKLSSVFSPRKLCQGYKNRAYQEHNDFFYNILRIYTRKSVALVNAATVSHGCDTIATPPSDEPQNAGFPLTTRRVCPKVTIFRCVWPLPSSMFGRSSALKFVPAGV